MYYQFLTKINTINTIQSYFQLQYKRLNRLLQELGIAPYFAYLLLLLSFIAVSKFLFYKTEYAAYLYPLLALANVFSLGELSRNEFLKATFAKADYPKIRLLENLLLISPFSLYLLYEQQYLIAFLLLVIGMAFSFIKNGASTNFVLPTPFYKYPFEFIVGFRQTFWVFILLYVLGGIALSVGNFNLGVFALVIVFFACWPFYAAAEPVYYIWTHAFTPSTFILQKIGIALLYSFLLSLPLALALVVGYPDKFLYILLAIVLGMAFLLLNLLGKYAFYPASMPIIQGFLLVFCLLFPPLLVIMLPYLYGKAIKNKNLYLNKYSG